MSYSFDHDRFVSKNRSLASAEEIKKKDEFMEKKGYTQLKRDSEGSCFNCKMKSTCTEFKAKRSGRASGVVSFGGDQKFICKRYIPASNEPKTMNNKQIKSLLKNAKKGYK
ncbi:hypothetical protein QA601_00140 [Chitinispirillales bacterium ANBcel5]|uniref:hypothetical protein n=1 Tax=Cellulosispirillum alkaliphilum TaxID=3039283 RepID=UPI002A596F30|nr:hypothetical protein [Chitinispirillales bacterium ANBcel5]